jgi:hypothetical protein
MGDEHIWPTRRASGVLGCRSGTTKMEIPAWNISLNFRQQDVSNDKIAEGSIFYGLIRPRQFD